VILGINGALFDVINDDLAGRFTPVDDVMKFCAQYLIFVVLGLLLASWFVRTAPDTDRRLAVYTGLAGAALGLLLGMLIRHYYVHERPFVLRPPGEYVQLISHSADASFPSDHTIAAFGMAVGAVLYRPRLGGVLLALAVVIGFSRVFVGVHYPWDVIGGAGVGTVAAVCVWAARPLVARLDRMVVPRIVPEFLR
jgi:undecaprenyl-diphosphatase